MSNVITHRANVSIANTEKAEVHLASVFGQILKDSLVLTHTRTQTYTHMLTHTYTHTSSFALLNEGGGGGLTH